MSTEDWLAVIGLCVLAIAVFMAGILLGIALRTHDPFLQSNFPCAEDEALMYVRYVHDRVVCVNVEEIANLR